MSFYSYLARKFPGLKHQLQMAKIDQNVEEYLQMSVRLAIIFAAVVSMSMFMMTKKFSFTLILSFLLTALIMFNLFRNRPKLVIKRRQQKIDRDLLFAGQYMLVKLQSGLPLFNSLIHASKEYNETGFFFREIVQDVNTGTPIERALAAGRDNCPSENMKKILSEIVTSLKTGANVVDTLRNSIDEISANLMLEVKGYNKKLNSIMMFYMILGTVIPSIGIALLIIFLSFAGILLTPGFLIAILFFLLILQFFFIAVVNNARPTVNV